MLFGSISPAFSSFHEMQIEQVIGGVNGNTNVQAIQLRMRTAGQNLVSNARLVAWDAGGANPVVVIDMGANVAISTAGSRVLIASAAFDSTLTPDPDFVMTNLIPVSYLTAGKLTFETDGGFVYWSLAWGAYTGTNTGSTVNDADGNFNPQFAASLPTSNTQALRFTGASSALSTNNEADYALTVGSAVFTNNAGTSGSALPPPPPP
jgi:hypothetical protein